MQASKKYTVLLWRAERVYSSVEEKGKDSFMLNEKRVILMTRMASYEAGEGKKNIEVGNYFRADYLAIQLLKAVAYGTVSFLLGFALYVVYSFETLMADIYNMDLIAFAKSILKYYLIFVIVYAVIIYIVGTLRYIHAKKNLKRYYQNLKILNASYGTEQKKKKSSGGAR